MDCASVKTHKTQHALAIVCLILITAVIALIGAKTAFGEEKTVIPTIRKYVEGDDGDWSTWTTSGVDVDVDFKLVATVAENASEFPTYPYEITDTLPDGMALDSDDISSVRVQLNDGDITEQMDISYDDHILTISTDDLAGVSDSSLSEDSVVTVTYRAHLTTACICGTPGNVNSAVLTYPVINQVDSPIAARVAVSKAPLVRLLAADDDVSDGNAVTTTETKTAETTTYTLALRISKVSSVNGSPVPGATMTIRAEDGRYVQRDGSLGTMEHEFTTDTDGHIEINGIDKGTYTIHETSAPSGYLTTSDIILTASTENADSGALVAIDATVSGGEEDGVDGDSNGFVESGTGVTKIDPTSGLIDIQITDPVNPSSPAGSPSVGSTPSLPQTGATAAGLALAGCGIMLCVIALAKRNKTKKDANSD